MITVDRIIHEGQDAVAVEFQYLELTDEVVARLREANIALEGPGSPFRRLSSIAVVDKHVAAVLQDGQVDKYLGLRANDILSQFGSTIVNLQLQKAEAEARAEAEAEIDGETENIDLGQE